MELMELLLQHGTEGAFGKIVQDSSPAIDAIISGHTHMLYDCEFPVTGNAVARPVVSAQNYSVAFDRIVMNVDDARLGGPRCGRRTPAPPGCHPEP